MIANDSILAEIAADWHDVTLWLSTNSSRILLAVVLGAALVQIGRAHV